MTYTTVVQSTIPERVLLAVDGGGPAESAEFGAALAAVHAARAALGSGEIEMEGTYWQADGEFDLERPDGWRWTLALPAPDGVEALDAEHVDPAVRLVRQPATAIVSTEHHGPYAEEATTLAALRAAAADRGLRTTGPHTERYLTDPRTTAPADLRTLLWYPVTG